MNDFKNSLRIDYKTAKDTRKKSQESQEIPGIEFAKIVKVAARRRAKTANKEIAGKER